MVLIREELRVACDGDTLNYDLKLYRLCVLPCIVDLTVNIDSTLSDLDRGSLEGINGFDLCRINECPVCELRLIIAVEKKRIDLHLAVGSSAYVVCILEP